MALKIAFLHHTTALYGASRSLINLVEGLKAHGVQSYVVVQEPCELVGVLERVGATVACVPYRWWVRLRGRGYRALTCLFGERMFVQRRYDDEAIARVVNLLREWDVDLVQTNSAVIPVGHFAARALGKPHIWHLRELMVHYGFRYDLGESASKKIINSSQACIAVSDCVARSYFDTTAPGIRKVIYNGVLSTEQFRVLREKSLAQGREHDGFVFGMVGMLYPSKGVDVAIRAFSTLSDEYPHARLVIAGSGTIDVLEKLAHDLGVASRIHFLGFVQNPLEFYPGIDALLMCSRNEAMGRVTIEANAACKPVIGYDDGGTSELIDHGKTGLLYDGNYEALAAAMKVYLDDPDLALEMGLAAWEKASVGFNTEVCASKFHQVVLDVLHQWKHGK